MAIMNLDKNLQKGDEKEEYKSGQGITMRSTRARAVNLTLGNEDPDDARIEERKSEYDDEYDQWVNDNLNQDRILPFDNNDDSSSDDQNDISREVQEIEDNIAQLIMSNQNNQDI